MLAQPRVRQTESDASAQNEPRNINVFNGALPQPLDRPELTKRGATLPVGLWVCEQCNRVPRMCWQPQICDVAAEPLATVLL